MIFQMIARQLGNPKGVAGNLAGFLWNRRNTSLNLVALDLLELQPADRVLEIGFGGGYLLSRISRVVTCGYLAGVDVSPAMVAFACKVIRKANPAARVDLKCASASSLPFPTGTFNKVCSVNSLFYWQDVEGGIREIRRVLVPGGRVVLCLTCKASLKNRFFSKHIRLFDQVELEDLLLANGFQDVNTQNRSDRHRQFLGIVGK